MKTKKTMLIVVALLVATIFSSCGGYGVDDPQPSIPESPVSFTKTLEANFFFSFGEYDNPSLAWYAHYSRDGKAWTKLSSANFVDGSAAETWAENPIMLGYYYGNTVKKNYVYYPEPTNSILIKQFVVFNDKKLNKEIFSGVKTMPEDKSDTIYANSFTRELIPVSLKDSLKIGKVDSLWARYGNKEIKIVFSVTKFDPIATALATYDSKNGLSYVLDAEEGPKLDSCTMLINSGRISFSKNLSVDSEGNLYLYPSDYGRNVKLVSIK